METKQIEIKNKSIFVFGIVLLLIGLVASFYAQVEYSEVYRNQQWIKVEVGRSYPFQTLGIVLVLAGILFVGIGFFYSQRKS